MSALETLENEPASKTRARLGTTVISGFLGAGKTTLLTHVLTSMKDLRVAIIVNDMSEVNIDADLLRARGISTSRTEETLVELSNGCICCTLRDDLLTEVRRLAESGQFDYLFIEATGISEPLPVAATFEFCDDNHESLADIARLDTTVTVVDAETLVADFDSRAFVRDRNETRDASDQRTVVELLVDQIEFADVLVLNKIGALDADERAEALRILRTLNADAGILECDFGLVEPGQIMNTGRFDPQKARSHPLWFQELHAFREHVPETEEYGISSFVYRGRAPMDERRLAAFLTGPLPGVLRAKGHFWCATAPDRAMSYSLAGRRAVIEQAGRWWAAVPQSAWPASAAARERILKHWDPVYGDRRNDLVFIGTAQMDPAAISSALDTCMARGPESGRQRRRLPIG